MENQLLSIILPIYNVEDFLPKCLDSLLSQTYDSWEALLIDDGSTDRSRQICDDYAQKDKRFKVFQIPNGGVSNARNYGLERAQGRWVTFVDGDDFAMPDYLTSLVEPMRKDELLDLVHVGYTHCNEKGEDGEKECFTDYTGSDYAMFLNTFHGEVFAKIYKRCIIEDNQLRFDTKVNIYEDLLFVLDYMVYASRFTFSSSTEYRYRSRTGSACAKAKSKGFQLPQQLKAIQHFALSLQTYIEVFGISYKDADYRWSSLSSNIFYSIRGTGLCHVKDDDAKALLKLFNYFPIVKSQHLMKRRLYLYAFIAYYRLVKHL